MPSDLNEKKDSSSGIVHCVLLRHGATKGNAEKRYIGRKTDEPLSEEGAAEISCVKDVAEESLVFTSPLLRARQTADIMFPSLRKIVIEDLSETDFGRFEGKNYKELSGDADYQRFIDSEGTIAFPEGESPEDFKRRSFKGFEDSIKKAGELNCRELWIVAHGGTIMSVLSQLTGKNYYDFMCPCGKGFEIWLSVKETESGEVIYTLTDMKFWSEEV